MLKQNTKIALRDTIILFALSLIPLLWFKKGHFIAGGDIAAYIDLSNYLKFLPYAWDEQVLAGRHNFAPHFLFPYGIFWAAFKLFRVSLPTIELLWACFTFLVSSLSMYYLIGVAVPGMKGGIGRLAGSALYIINPFLANTPLLVQYNLAPVYMFTPLILALFMKGLSADSFKESFKFASLIALASLFFASSSLNITHLFVLGLIFISYFLYYVITNPKRVVPALAFALLCAIAYFLVNVWWLSVSFTKMVSMSETVATSHGKWEVLNATTLADACRFIGSWAWRTGHRDVPYFPYNEVYDRWPFLLIAFGIVIVVFSALWVRPRASAYAALLALIGLFVVKGSTGPFGFAYKWAWEHVPGFWIFREPFAKFTPVNTLAYSLLFAIAADFYYNKLLSVKNKFSSLRNALKATFPLIVVVILLTFSFPMMTREWVWDQYNGEMRSLHVKVPDYWYQAGRWFKENDPDSRIMPMPKTGYGKSSFNWESGFMAECSPVKNLFSNPLVHYEDFPHTSLQKSLSQIYALYKKDAGDVYDSRIVRLFGVGHILHQKDVDWRFTWPDAVSHERLSAILGKDKGLKLVNSFGKLDVYKILDPLPVIYAAEKATIVDDKDESLFNMDAETLSSSALFVFKKDQIGSFDFSSLRDSSASAKPPAVTFWKINPSKYVVDIKAESPFWLILNNTFSPEWTAYIDRTGKDSPSSRKRVFLDRLFNGKRWSKVDKHFVVNSYANGWQIDETGSYQIVIQYEPQSSYELYIYISFTTVIFLILYLLYSLRKRQ